MNPTNVVSIYNYVLQQVFIYTPLAIFVKPHLQKLQKNYLEEEPKSQRMPIKSFILHDFVIG